MQVLLNIILVVNLFVCVALIAVVLLQRSEGGALGMGGGGPSGFMTARGAGDLLTRITWILAFVFFFLSIVLTVISGRLHGGVGSLVDHINVNSLDLSSPKKPAAPAAPAGPSSAPPPVGLQAPTPQPQTQAPAAPAANPLAGFEAPTVKVPAPQQAPAPAPQTQTPPKK